MDAQWADDVHHALHTWLTGERQGYYCDFGSSETLAHAFTRVFVHDGGYSTFRDQDWGAPVPDDMDRRRFVTFTQNHDQVGNRAMGDRPDASLPPALVAVAPPLLLLGPFTPMLFQGQEWSTAGPFQFFTDHDPELGAMVTRGRREEFADHGWADGVRSPTRRTRPRSRRQARLGRTGTARAPADAGLAPFLIAARRRLLQRGDTRWRSSTETTGSVSSTAR